MKSKATTLREFLKYIESNKLSSVMLFHSLKARDGYIYDFENNEKVEDIRDFTDDLVMSVRNVGKKSLEEFKELRRNYLQYISSIKTDCEEEQHETEKFSCWLRSDISKTLKSIENYISYIEQALLEKFERDGIELIRSKD